MNQPNGLKKCLSCATCDPGLGLFAKQNCKSTSDTVCDVLSGFFCKSLTDSTGCSTAERHSVCKPGERIKQPGTSRHDTVCEACQQGSFSPNGVNCTLWTKIMGITWAPLAQEVGVYPITGGLPVRTPALFASVVVSA
ncbi:hypothetical protein CCH79_00020922, partial [Gambusia affinis]